MRERRAISRARSSVYACGSPRFRVCIVLLAHMPGKRVTMFVVHKGRCAATLRFRSGLADDVSVYEQCRTQADPDRADYLRGWIQVDEHVTDDAEADRCEKRIESLAGSAAMTPNVSDDRDMQYQKAGERPEVDHRRE